MNPTSHKYRIGLLTLTFILSTNLHAHQDNDADKTLMFEQSSSIPLYFKQDDPLRVDNNDFEILHQQFMSNRQGERWALITLKNTSSGRRIFDRNDIVATFADGYQRYPATEIKASFSGYEIRTLSLFFGEHRFPLAHVSVE